MHLYLQRLMCIVFGWILKTRSGAGSVVAVLGLVTIPYTRMTVSEQWLASRPWAVCCSSAACLEVNPLFISVCILWCGCVSSSSVQGLGKPEKLWGTLAQPQECHTVTQSEPLMVTTVLWYECYTLTIPCCPDCRPYVRSKGRKFERARGRRKSRGYKA